MSSFSEAPHPVQIISTGSNPDDESNSFGLVGNNLSAILCKVPSGMKVSVLTVVGAFRSGKSFLLTFFLRYLANGNPNDLSEAWMHAKGERLAEGNVNQTAASQEEQDNLRGFAWRGGHERQTTGIWMWSEPFIWKSASSSEPFAILLMDTQGMFDNQTTMDVTVQIFGLSTLVSSYQIYNVDKRIQEDNLQHLACFSEYGRMALDDGNTKVVVEAADDEQSDEKINSKSLETESSVNNQAPPPTMQRIQSLSEKPFQRIEFLVRDWQNFDAAIDSLEEQPEDEQNRTYIKLKEGMLEYFASVVDTRKAPDLQGTRDQISRCFEKVSCYLLPHPGTWVTKKTFDGSIDKIDYAFRAMLNRYVHVIFDEYLEPKRFNGREITAPELLTFMTVYTEMFSNSNGQKFPKAMTMLDATAAANNRNAYDLAISSYRQKMDKMAGPNSDFVKEALLLGVHVSAKESSLQIFDSIANMGVISQIKASRDHLLKDIAVDENRYFELNSHRNPFKDMEYIIGPLVVAAICFIIAKIVDITCSSDFCEV